MMSMHDDLFGALSLQALHYCGECDVPFFGESTVCGLSISTDEDLQIQDEQREVFVDFMKHKELYAQQAEIALFHYYLSERDDLDDESAPMITEVGQLKNMIEAVGVTIFQSELFGRSFGLAYGCTWNDRDLGVRFVDGLVVKAGDQCIIRY